MDESGQWRSGLTFQFLESAAKLRLTLWAAYKRDGESSAAWLEKENFELGRVRVHADLVWLESSSLRTAYHRSDGTPAVIERLMANGKPAFKISTEGPRRPPAVWARLIRSDIKQVAGKAPDAWDLMPATQEFAGLLVSGLARSPSILDRPNQLRSVIDVMFSILLSSGSVDAFFAQESTGPDFDADASARRLADHLWAPIWRVVSTAMSVRVRNADKASLRECMWSSLSSRLRMAGALAKRAHQDVGAGHPLGNGGEGK